MRTTPTIKLPGIAKMQLVNVLGLLVNQAAVYGVEHKVVRDALPESFGKLRKLLQQYGTVEMELQGEHFFVNKSRDSMAAGVCKSLVDRMRLHRITLLHFSPPGNFSEFKIWLELFSAYPRTLEPSGGFLAALERAKLHGIHARQVEWRSASRKSDGALGTGDAVAAKTDGGAPRIDLQEALTAWEQEFVTQDTGVDTLNIPVRSHADCLAARLRRLARLLEADHALGEQEGSQPILHELSEIRDAMSASGMAAMESVAAFSKSLAADSRIVDTIESGAQQQGAKLDMTRAETIRRHAELNQEIMQPLTVSSGVIDMLHSGRLGTLSEAQQEMLKLAAESLERVQQLAEYMRQMVGLPQSFAPDSRIIRETYRQG